MDLQKRQTEQLRWLIIQTLNTARPVGANEALVLDVVHSMQPDVTSLQVRRELDYLKGRSLVAIDVREGVWHAELTRHGVDIAEYTVDVHPGIARPPRYW